MAERWGWAGVGLLLAVAVLGPVLPVGDPLATSVAEALQPPSWAHPFGTDYLGRDMAARVVRAAGLDLGLAVAGVALAVGLGGVIGALTGWFGGWADRLGSVLVDMLLAMPIYLAAMVLVGVIGNTLGVVVLVTGMVNLPVYIRLVRTEVSRLRRGPAVDAMRMHGEGDSAILGRLILPEVAPLIAVQAASTLGLAILNAAGLSFIGIGVRPPTPEWGILIAEGARHMGGGAWWLVVFPGAALVLAVMSFHRVGEALRVMLIRGRR